MMPLSRGQFSSRRAELVWHWNEMELLPTLPALWFCAGGEYPVYTSVCEHMKYEQYSQPQARSAETCPSSTKV